MKAKPTAYWADEKYLPPEIAAVLVTSRGLTVFPQEGDPYTIPIPSFEERMRCFLPSLDDDPQVSCHRFWPGQ